MVRDTGFRPPGGPPSDPRRDSETQTVRPLCTRINILALTLMKPFRGWSFSKKLVLRRVARGKGGVTLLCPHHTRPPTGLHPSLESRR